MTSPLPFVKKKYKTLLNKVLRKVVYLKNKYNIRKEYLSLEKEMVARAFFVGLFIAFIPMPMQMMAVFLVVPFLRFNVPIAFLVCWITNPFTMPFIYYTEYTIGSYLLGLDLVENMSFTLEEISEILKPLYYGAFILSISISTTAYYSTKYLWKKKKKGKNLLVIENKN